MYHVPRNYRARMRLVCLRFEEKTKFPNSTWAEKITRRRYNELSTANVVV